MPLGWGVSGVKGGEEGGEVRFEGAGCDSGVATALYGFF